MTPPDESELEFECLVSDAREDVDRPFLYQVEGAANGVPTHCWRGLIERYVNREIAFAVRVDVLEGMAGRPCDRHSEEYGVLLYWPWPGPIDHLELGAGGQIGEFDLNVTKQRARDMQRAVLVSVRQFAEMPQGATEVLPCAVRLLRSDQLDGVLPDIPEVLGDAPVSKALLRFENGELVLRREFWGLAGVKNDELPDRVVECRPEVVKYFPDLDSPHGVGFFYDLDTGRHYSLPQIDLTDRLVRLLSKEALELGTQSLYLIPCAPELQSDAVELVSHD
jgi:hypothetical protein